MKKRGIKALGDKAAGMKRQKKQPTQKVESDACPTDVSAFDSSCERINDYDKQGKGTKKTLEFSDDDDDAIEDDLLGTDDTEGQQDSDEVDQDDDASSDDDDDEGTDYRQMAKQSRKLDMKREREAREAAEEMQRDASKELGDVLGTSDDDAEEPDASMLDVTTLKTRIQNIMMILSNFSGLRDAKISRSQYIDKLLKYLAAYYGYSEYLIEKIFYLFPHGELVEFLEASDVARPMTIRTNTLKTKRRDLAQALISRGVNVDPMDAWSKVGLQVFDSPVPIGATPEYLAGHYMLQAAASFLPVLALAPQEHERVLDMCAAPGGKTTYLAQLMRNTGQLFSNDVNKDRMKATVANVHRMGIKNVVISVLDGRAFPEVIGGFDRVLLDAPCSGTGVISKDPSVKVSKSQEDFKLLTHLQKELILAAIDSLDAASSTGGVLVYSTCSVCVEENEDIVSYALKKRPNVKLVETGLDFGTPGFSAFRGRKYHKDMSLTRRFYPHTHNLDGFFVAKFLKTSSTIPMSEEERKEHDDKIARLQERRRQAKQAKRLKAEFRAAKNKAS